MAPGEVKITRAAITPTEMKQMLSRMEEKPCVKLGDFNLTIEMDEPDSDLMEVARKELRETPELVQESVRALRDLLREDDRLTVPMDNEAWLIRFLRPCKFYPESAYELIKRYYQFKVKHHNIYDNLKPSTEKKVFEHNVISVLPKRDQFGRRILILELGKKWKHNKVCLDEVFKGAVLFLEAAMMEPQSQICGSVVIFDMDGLSLQQVWQFTPPFAKRIVDWLQDAVPLRIKNIHVVNQPYIFNMVFALFKPFLREKLRSRIIFHGSDRDSLYSYLDPKCLPSSYGGTLDIPQVTGSQWLELLLMLDREFDAINSYGYEKDNESKK